MESDWPLLFLDGGRWPLRMLEVSMAVQVSTLKTETSMSQESSIFHLGISDFKHPLIEFQWSWPSGQAVRATSFISHVLKRWLTTAAFQLPLLPFFSPLLVLINSMFFPLFLLGLWRALWNVFSIFLSGFGWSLNLWGHLIQVQLFSTNWQNEMLKEDWHFQSHKSRVT